MHRAMASRQLVRGLASAEPLASTIGVPLFLCPALARYPAMTFGRVQSSSGATSPRTNRQFLCQRRRNHTQASATTPGVNHDDTLAQVIPSPESATHDADFTQPVSRQLPMSCSGCGAFAQTTDPKQLGYYDLTAKRVRQWLKPLRANKPKSDVTAKEDQVVESVLANMDEARLKELGLDPELLSILVTPAEPPQVETPKEPLCDRCHLLTHEIGNPEKVEMFHPTVDSLRETIEESPHKNNHIYHIIDAADFPMSLIPRLNVLLGDIPMRTRNRRSRSGKYMNDRKTEISFIISRGDLLGPTKESVDRMMPYLREVLREALGRVGGRVRLGNVHCVSAKRAWWTKELKRDIWKRGGAGWFVGKVNVGKSRLFETVFPKGMVTHGSKTVPPASLDPSNPEDSAAVDNVVSKDPMDFGDLLPPPRPLEMYPQMPIVSPHPGTTASPIRIPYGNHRGELIDLPGLARSDLEHYVKPEYRDSLVMQSRIVPTQISAQHGRSLILGGGLIRITPTTPDVTFLMYNFTRLSEHLTATEKAVEFQAQTRKLGISDNISTEEAAEKMASAGTFKLRYDVTKARAGPLVKKHLGGKRVEDLPFRVVSLDLLIEGVGYVEVVAQVRTRDLEEMIASQAAEDLNATTSSSGSSAPEPESEKSTSDDPFQALAENRIDTSRPSQAAQQPVQQTRPARPTKEWPTVEVFTPEGRFVDYRQPINGWLNNKPLILDKHKKKRPRKSMRGAKKKVKQTRRAMTQEE
ncbi:hypothetical protein NLU13_6352 [Sarocladium strictum]|uniref:Genetic interactor of prohibitins 3, mitochondrial n=1 Tax=Sarocladium strictum TaxID=5046 RepID=A0AA39GI51_SARSR|nr:hypothetical protein NLU13_6352 [Sarocladium strictum]